MGNAKNLGQGLTQWFLDKFRAWRDYGRMDVTESFLTIFVYYGGDYKRAFAGALAREY